MFRGAFLYSASTSLAGRIEKKKKQRNAVNSRVQASPTLAILLLAHTQKRTHENVSHLKRFLAALRDSLYTTNFLSRACHKRVKFSRVLAS